MAGVSEWLKSEQGLKIISFIWGIGISLLFFHQCNDRKCFVIKSPPIKEIQNHVFAYSGNEDECYSFTPYYVPCNSSKSE
jgi:hypothetical protein